MNIAFIGLGNMGAPMASHLSKQHKITAYNRSPSKTQAWLAQHPEHKTANNAQDACKNTHVLILCVGNDQDVEQLIFGEQGAHLSLTKGSLIIDHSTTSSELAKRMHSKLKPLGIDYVDAPVSGGEQGAINGQLTIMCGGDLQPCEQAKTLTQCYAKSFTHMGEVGTGQLTKMVNQICVAGLIQALAEGINFGQKAGLDMDKVMNTLGNGAASSWQMLNRSTTMIKQQFDFGFAVDHMQKDLNICLNTAKTMHINLPTTKVVSEYYSELQRQGHGKLDTSSLILRLNKKT
ncbi:NAD(P)-dependent oxidoreductase [Bermanella sp. WJH001]|uniref:NAD(P)-dependent oxidoreductase n=1 Tax=Bermanella sp. WJH001 TaxID=3048005 RepID=UPI0024BEF734|nr:NAD(P)-dependent oxidoreductase [Bermanella sp. WJH001]MDJ1536602.1 NAD(P)-dependent oxidoreductase [Bermanella sp. WJH001]